MGSGEVRTEGDVGGYNGDRQGLAIVTFDSTSGTVGGATRRIFVGTADNTAPSVYVSEDAGSSWDPVSDQLSAYFPHKAVFQPEEKALYLTYSDGTATWNDTTLVSGSDLYFGFGGIGVDMQNPGTVVVASLNSWWPDAQLFRSIDSGVTWSRVVCSFLSIPSLTVVFQAAKAPWIKTGFIDTDTKDLGWMIEAPVIDPLDSDHWLYSTGLTLFGAQHIDPVTRRRHRRVLRAGSCLGSGGGGGGELLAAVGDDSGFTFRDAAALQTSPQTPWMNPIWSTSSSVDYAGTSAEKFVRTGNSAGSQQVAVSSDGGESWNTYPGADSSMDGGMVAYSADAETVLWSTSTSGVQRSQYPTTFSSASSLPSGSVIAADKKNSAVFYAGSAASFYVSTDMGTSFSKSPIGSATAVRDIAAHPATEGDAWVSTDADIFHSTNYGSSFTKSEALVNTYQIALGRGTGDTWNIYAFGTGSAGTKLYGSVDNGATWTDIQGSQGFGSVDSCKLAGSGNVPGQVYSISIAKSSSKMARGSSHSHVVDQNGPGSAASSTFENIIKPVEATGGKTKCIDCGDFECCCIPCVVM
ncbi:hypothetical protein Hte_001623 [Hypoxylon texense]